MSRIINGRSFVDFAEFAAHQGVSDRTARNWAALGYFRVYKVNGLRGYLIDPVEADAELAKLPAARIRRGWGTLGPKARVVHLAETVQS